jgi:hypothetical protein
VQKYDSYDKYGKYDDKYGADKYGKVSAGWRVCWLVAAACKQDQQPASSAISKCG